MTRRAHAHQRGFTLIELMIAIIVSSIVVLGIYAFSSIQQSTASMHERNVRIQQALEGAMWSIGQDVRHAGLGWARACTELRVWDPLTSRVINPSGVGDPNEAARDPISGEAYWVLRDGVQAFWNSGPAPGFADGVTSSAAPESAADAFDVIVAEPNYVQTFGAFTISPDDADPTDATITVRTSALLDKNVVTHLAQVRQLFPPGSFIAVARTPAAGSTTVPLRPEAHGQCPLLQITGDVQPSAGGGDNDWDIPVDTTSGFNADLAALIADDPLAEQAVEDCEAERCTDDWSPPDDGEDMLGGATVVPLGRLRWSRYEIDYTVATQPYLVRYDIIGWQDGADPDNFGGEADYPHCQAGECRAAQLHLPGSESPPLAVAMGPMIEDMQVAVACDGYTAAAADAAGVPIPVPDAGYEEVGPAVGPTADLPNAVLDENPNESGQRNADEWVGNAVDEQSAPDCVWYGAGEWAKAQWAIVDTDNAPPPSFRMSPQAIRITLVGSTELVEQAGGVGALALDPIEDRVALDSAVGVRHRFALTERFTPDNTRWRDPTIQ